MVSKPMFVRRSVTMQQFNSAKSSVARPMNELA